MLSPSCQPPRGAYLIGSVDRNPCARAARGWARRQGNEIAPARWADEGSAASAFSRAVVLTRVRPPTELFFTDGWRNAREIDAEYRPHRNPAGNTQVRDHSQAGSSQGATSHFRFSKRVTPTSPEPREANGKASRLKARHEPFAHAVLALTHHHDETAARFERSRSDLDEGLQPSAGTASFAARNTASMRAAGCVDR